jgi:hypothetical protein
VPVRPSQTDTIKPRQLNRPHPHPPAAIARDFRRFSRPPDKTSSLQPARGSSPRVPKSLRGVSAAKPCVGAPKPSVSAAPTHGFVARAHGSAALTNGLVALTHGFVALTDDSAAPTEGFIAPSNRIAALTNDSAPLPRVPVPPPDGLRPMTVGTVAPTTGLPCKQANPDRGPASAERPARRSFGWVHGFSPNEGLPLSLARPF